MGRIEEIEANIEGGESSAERFEGDCSANEGRIEVLQAALSRLENDAALALSVEKNAREAQRERESLDEVRANLLRRLEDIQSLVEGENSECAGSKAIVAELEAFGEDVSKALGVIERREAALKECENRIRELVERLGGALEASSGALGDAAASGAAAIREKEGVSEQDGGALEAGFRGKEDPAGAIASDWNLAGTDVDGIGQGGGAAPGGPPRGPEPDGLCGGGQVRVDPKGIAAAGELLEKTRRLNEGRYRRSVAFAQENDFLRDFTDHGPEHIGQVEARSLEAANALQLLFDDGFALEGYSKDVSYPDLAAAANYHDTGMGASEGYCVDSDGKVVRIPDFVPKDEASSLAHLGKTSKAYGEAIRKSHPLNSALYVLSDRDALEREGVNVDKVALECFAHSKSASGIRDLRSGKEWSDAERVVREAAELYSIDHPDAPISFDGAKCDAGQLRTETLALRMGDANRDTAFNGRLHSGESYRIFQTGIVPNDAADAQSEADAYTIRTKTRDVGRGSRQFVLGESNIPRCRVRYDSATGKLVDSITVAKGSFCPECTQKAIADRLGEMATVGSDRSAKRRMECRIRFGEAPSPNARKAYEDWAEDRSSTTGILITFE